MLRVLSTPALFALELTPLCNSRCPGCSNTFVEDKRTRSGPQMQRQPLSFEQWRTILDSLAPHAHRFKLTGGEPTLYPEFKAIVGHIRDLGKSLTVFTNGRWPDPDSILSALADTPNLTGLLISLHGAHAASHAVFAGVSCFDETTANIRRAVKAGISVTLSAVLHRANLDELSEIVALAQALGADHVVFSRYLGLPVPEIAITAAQLMQAAHAVDALRKQGQPVTFGVCIPQCFTPSSSTGCLAGVAFCTIDPWGNLRPCNHSPLITGNLLDGTLEQAWHSPEMERFRQAIPDACHTCAAFSTCHGGCRALAMELELPGDPLMVGPLHKFDPPPPVRMGRNWRPLRRFEVRREPFGLVLMRGNALIAVRPEATVILDYLDGTHTLGELAHKFDPAALSLIGELFRRNMIKVTI